MGESRFGLVIGGALLYRDRRRAGAPKSRPALGIPGSGRDDERRDKEAALSHAERLAARLRALGVDPDEDER